MGNRYTFTVQLYVQSVGSMGSGHEEGGLIGIQGRMSMRNGMAIRRNKRLDPVQVGGTCMTVTVGAETESAGKLVCDILSATGH